VTYQNQLINTFISILNLPQSRFDVETVLAILQNPAVQQRFKFDEEAISIIRDWLRETHTRWGLDGEDKQRFELPGNEANTWRAGLDRLLLAYALPQANQVGHLFENNLSFDAISGERAVILAQLCAFIDCLDRCRQRLSAAKTAEQWQQSLNKVIDDLFLITADQHQFEHELTTLRQTIEQFVDSVLMAEFVQPIEASLMQDWLNQHLDSQQTQSRFMGHGLTFCGMVPMRSIPFEVVCLIGMNDDSYPRRQPKLGFDLLANNFRLGDRSRREDDRYLFLEAILSAQSTLYISYVGASVHDNASIPPSVLVSDLRDVLNLSFCGEEQKDIWLQLLTQHPLQAFSRRYFDGGDERLFSYQRHNCPTQLEQRSSNWFEQPLTQAGDEWKQVSIQQLIQFFRHPVRYLLTERLGLRLELNDEQLEIREPFQLDGLQAWQLRQQLLSAKLEQSPSDEIYDYVQASGALPQGAMAEQLFEQQQQQVERYAETLISHYPDSFIEPENIDLTIGEFHVNGMLQGLSNQGLFFYRMAKTKGSDLLSAWLQHLVLNMHKPKVVVLQTELITEDNHYQFKPVVDAESHLKQLLELYWQGLHSPLPLFNNTSFAYAKASLNEKSRANPDNAMWAAWLGGQYANGEADDLYHQQVFPVAPLDETFKQLAEAVYAPLQQNLMEVKL
jgi:exodeoxyribonuclease V gamma subunit